eukprot:5812884-Lingulodinium_polyedra.AAC.1
MKDPALSQKHFQVPLSVAAGAAAAALRQPRAPQQPSPAVQRPPEGAAASDRQWAPPSDAPAGPSKGDGRGKGRPKGGWRQSANPRTPDGRL